MNKVQENRLSNVAVALRDIVGVPEYSKYFTMRTYGHGCGSPACAFGQYAFRGDLQKTFGLDVTGDPFVLRHVVKRLKKLGKEIEFFIVARKHFGIDYEEYMELFDSDGCDGAKTPLQAAKYVERFVRRKVKTQKREKKERERERDRLATAA